MKYITIQDLQKFQNKFVDEEDEDLLQTYVDAGIEKVNSYLGYDPSQKEYTQHLRGDNGCLLALKARPIEELSVDADEESFIAVDDTNFICAKNNALFIKDKVYEVKYKGGYEEVPAVIKMCALQIASLYWESSGGNLAVSSTSFAESGSRVFNNFKADRFLEAIEDFKIKVR